jgi:hypothetical protein
MKHTNKSASPGELACPHLSDHPTQEAKQRSNPNHGRSVSIPIPPSSRRRYFAMSLRRSADTLLARKLARKWHVGIFKNPSKTPKLVRKTHSFFSEDPNVDSRSACSAYPSEKIRNSVPPLAISLSLEPFVTTFREANNSCWAPDSWRAGPANFAYSVVQRIDHLSPDFPTQNAFLKLNVAAIFSLQPLALSLSPHSRSACSAYPYEKIRNLIALCEGSVFRGVSFPSQHFCNLQAVDFAEFSRCLQITQNFSKAEIKPET